MAWNQPGEDKKRPPQRSAPDDGRLDELLRRTQRRIQQLWRPGGNRVLAMLTLLGLLAALWLLTGLHQTGDSERGIVQRFGRYIGTDPPGYSWHWPWPIDTVRRVDVSNVDALDSKSLMLASDQSVMDIGWSVQYRVADPVRFLFQVREPQDDLRQSSEVVLRELVAAHPPSALLDGESPARMAVEARGRIQAVMDAHGAGIDVAAVNFSDVRLPDAVQGAEREVSKAAEDRQHALAEAQAYANDIGSKAQNEAQQQLSDAQIYATRTRAAAEGDAERFAAQAQAYSKAPEITRSRMYIDTMQSILAKAHKIIIDTHTAKGNPTGAGSVVYIPLDKLAEAIRAGASAPGPSASGAGASGSAAPAGSASTEQAPAAAGTPAPAGNPAGSSEPPDDGHGRERPER